MANESPWERPFLCGSQHQARSDFTSISAPFLKANFGDLGAATYEKRTVKRPAC